jgi:Cullin family
MLSGFKEACGFDFIAKLQKMFNDVQNSRDLNQSFQDSLAASKTCLPADFSIMVGGQVGLRLEHVTSQNLEGERESVCVCVWCVCVCVCVCVK